MGEFLENEKALSIRPEWAVSNFDGLIRISKELLTTGFLPASIKTSQQAVAIILTGKELGIPTMQALRQINVIQGKPTLPPELLLSLAYQRVKGFSTKIIETNDAKCVIEFRRETGSYTSIFTMQDAARMGLNTKDNWRKQPATMLRWRCIAQGLRVIAPDAIMGIYTPEEMNPDVVIDSEGQVVDTPQPRHQNTISTKPLRIPPPTQRVESIHVRPAYDGEDAMNSEGSYNLGDASGLPCDDDVGFPAPPPPATTPPVVSDVVSEAVDLFQPKSVKTIPPVEKEKKRKPAKPPTLRVSPEQIDVLGAYIYKDELRKQGFRWNAEIGAWSTPFSEEALTWVNGLLGTEASL